MTRKSNREIYKESQEPSWSDEIPNDVDVIGALSFYTEKFNLDDSVQFLIEYLTQENKQDLIDKVKAADKWRIPKALGFYLRMKGRGLIPSTSIANWINVNLEQLNKLQPKEKKQVVVKAKSTNNASSIISIFEGFLDEMITQNHKSLKRIDVKSILENRHVTHEQVLSIVEYYTPILQEIKSVVDDPELQEAYAKYSVNQRANYILFLQNIINEAKAYSKVSVSEKKSRKRKEKSPEILVKLMTVKSNWQELGLKGLEAKDIVGAREIWIYNTKYNFIGYYRAAVGQELSVHRASVTNYEEAKGKRLRDAREAFQWFKSCDNRREMMNVFKVLKNRQFDMRKHISDDVLIYRIFK